LAFQIGAALAMDISGVSRIAVVISKPALVGEEVLDVFTWCFPVAVTRSRRGGMPPTEGSERVT
jgi:hypothetical protein